MSVFSAPSVFSPAGLPPFYAAVLNAWKALNGSASPNGLVVRSLAENVIFRHLPSLANCVTS